jgi:hypothetical protein
MGRGRHCLKGYDKPNPIVAGIALMGYPSEWPTLCEEYPVMKYLQHSKWANDVYKPYFGNRCAIWPVGIDTEAWRPSATHQKTTDVLVYDKILWDYEQKLVHLREPILQVLRERNLTFEIIRYGRYSPLQFQQALQRCRAMVFLCEHESQGIAYQECLSSDVPILAYDQGWYLDPSRFGWGQVDIPASSVPYFDERCGMKFENIAQFPERLEDFWNGVQAVWFRPRDYISENLTLEKCTKEYVQLFEQCSK